MATQWISPTWRMPENSNQSKVDNYSLEFDGTADYIDVSTVSLGTTQSLSWWIYRDSSSTQECPFGDTTSGLSDMLVYMNGLTLYYRVGGTSLAWTNALSSALTNQKWCNIVITRDGASAKLYLNSTFVSEQTLTGGDITAAVQVDRIGASSAGTPAFYINGKMSNIALFTSELSQAQITALYNSGTPVNPMALTPLPVAYYPLGGSSTGSASTLTVPNDAVPSATVFDFVSADGDRFVIPGGIGAGPVNGINGALTVSIWVNTTAGLIYEYAFNRDRFGGTNRDWFLIKDNFYGSGGRMYFGVYNTSNVLLQIRLTGSTDPQGDPLITMNDGKWHHIVGIYDGTETVELYTDGVLQGTNTSAGHGAINTTTRTAIGGYNNSDPISSGAGSWNGDLSNAQIWDTNLSSAEVVTLYNNGVPLLTGTQPEAANLKGWWKMNVDTSTWNGSDWTISNSSANYPNSLQFNGTSSYIDTSSFTTSGDDVTISMWLNAINISSATPSTTADILYGNATNFVRYNVNEVIYARINGADALLVANSGGVPQIFGTGNWHHLAIVKSGSTVTWYIDGVAYTNLGSGTTGGFTMNYIGANGGSSNNFLNGQLSNVAIFESALDASAITTLYNGGQPETAISSSPLSWWKLNNLTTGIQDSGSASNNGTNYGATISGIAVSQVNGISFGMTTANLVTSDLTRSIPYSSYSMQFDATNDYVIVPANVLTNFTTSVWLNRDGNGNYDGILGQDTTSAKGGILRYVALQDDDIYIYLDAWYTVATTLALNTWIHFCLTYDSTADELKSYINGILDTTIASPDFSGASTDAHSFTRIGLRNGTDATSFPGKLNNVSLFNSALSQDQILTIYNGGVPNDISSLSPVSWWSLSGDSYYDGTNWICPDLGSAGNNGTSANMAGTEIIGDGPGSTANGIATSMDIPANLKGNAPNSTKNAFSVNMTEIDRVTSVPG